MELDSEFAKEVIDKINSANSISFSTLSDVVIDKYPNLFNNHQLYIHQVPQTNNITAGMYPQNALSTYTQPEIIEQLIQFSEFQIELKRLLEILEYLKANNYVTTLIAQPSLSLLNPIIWSKGNSNTQTANFWRINDMPLFHLLLANFSTSISRNPELQKLISQEYKTNDEYRFQKTMSKSNTNLGIASIVGIISLATLVYTCKQLTNIDTITIDEEQLESIEKKFEEKINVSIRATPYIKRKELFFSLQKEKDGLSKVQTRL